MSEWTRKNSLYIMEKNEIMTFAWICLKLEIVMLRGESWTNKACGVREGCESKRGNIKDVEEEWRKKQTGSM